MSRHPYDYEAPPPSQEGERAQHQHDERRDPPAGRLNVVPSLAAYDIHAKLMEAIQNQDVWVRESESEASVSYAAGLRDAYRIVFGEDAP